jgi:hypothetical protein
MDRSDYIGSTMRKEKFLMSGRPKKVRADQILRDLSKRHEKDVWLTEAVLSRNAEKILPLPFLLER